MASFKKTNTKIYAKVKGELTEDNIYWKKYSPPILLKEYGPIDYIDFSPIEPHYFAVTCSVRVQIYNPITKLVEKNLNKFQEAAYGGSFRPDGKLICAGGQEAVIRLFDVHNRSLLRLFSGHTAAVHRVFFTADGHHLASFSDDKTTALWDIPTEKQLITYADHTDYIRAGAISPISPDIFVSGSYDKTIKMYDTRTNKSTLSVNHEAPVESVIFLPSGGIFISAGGTEMRVWDALTGGRLLAKVSHHHKTITCLTTASNGHRILSGSLDRHVQIYDVSTYQRIHTLDYPNSILSIGISKNDETIVTGMVDGMISVRRREDDTTAAPKIKRKNKFFRRTGPNLPSIDVVVPSEKKELMSKYDACLRKFQYSKALDCVMVTYVVNKLPHVTVAVLQELTRRQGLQQSLAGRDSKSLVNILKFLIKYLGTPRFSRILLHVTQVLIDIYEDNIDELDPEVIKLLTILEEKLREEQELITSMTELQGILYMLLSGAESKIESVIAKESQTLEPSSAAQKNLILSIS
ncbi:U3 small nucleolar RNA-associated protein 15 homolog [Chelonus insularis]|uniref:U3 small nucleolar RNA-associated protein 15 homolog n=1 Tax=Chelonus insularis TaxID=460826 RepID=UPI00158E1CED|nr:U3 small nucleolar RNA-associated protein 15 homolog [Chelonus insularis]